MRVKICGVRRLHDAQLAANLGADAIGVLVGQAHPSGDFLSPPEAAAILRGLPPLVSGVLVSHWSDPAALLKLIAAMEPAVLQLHSAITPADVQRLRQARPGLTLLKAVHVGRGAPLAEASQYAALVDGFVADSCNPATGQVGGTGLPHDWRLTARLVAQLPRPLLLAGGLNPANVAEAIATAQPWGVDVNSGVRGTDGFKDPTLLERFIAQAKG